MDLTRLALPLLAASFVTDGADALARPASHVARARHLTDPVSQALAGRGLPRPGEGLLRAGSRAMGAVSLAAGLGLAAGVAPRACALVLAGVNVPVTVVNNPVWLADDDEQRSRCVSGLARGAAVGAGLLLVAAGVVGTRAEKGGASGSGA